MDNALLLRFIFFHFALSRFTPRSAVSCASLRYRFTCDASFLHVWFNTSLPLRFGTVLRTCSRRTSGTAGLNTFCSGVNVICRDISTPVYHAPN